MTDETCALCRGVCCAKHDTARERLEIVEAQRAALIGVLSELIAYVRNTGGFMFAEEQATLRHAIAVLAEVQR